MQNESVRGFSMIIRQARAEETDQIIREGYDVCSKNRSFEQYDKDNRKEDAYGTRYIAKDNGEIVSSLILLRLPEMCTLPETSGPSEASTLPEASRSPETSNPPETNSRKVFGIGSVLTPVRFRHRGYAAALLESCLEQIGDTHGFIFLYSEIAPSFYEKFHFRPLPDTLQKAREKAVCMVLCDEPAWAELTGLPAEKIPDYF